MESIMKEQERLEKRANLEKSIVDVQGILDQLNEAKNAVSANPSACPLILARTQFLLGKSFDKTNDDLKEIHSGLNKYSKAVDKKLKETPLAFVEDDSLVSQASLINRAIAMHLLREGHFEVASTFISEANASPPLIPPPESPLNKASLKQPALPTSSIHLQQQTPEKSILETDTLSWETEFSPTVFKPANLKQQFSEMYHILHELRNKHNLAPAIAWARHNSALLEARGSNLEFDLCRLQYISLFSATPAGELPIAAIQYARETFPRFPERYSAHTYALLGALAYTPRLETSPYEGLFSPSLETNTAAAAAAAFTAEFCALLSLSSASPLLTAVTAGCIALPKLAKLSQIQQVHRTSWTTAMELPAEIPLPPGFQFHSIFVCPVSKEQSTDTNPPMMMPCGHVVAKESLDRLARAAKFKCPYCPNESFHKDAIKLFL